MKTAFRVLFVGLPEHLAIAPSGHLLGGECEFTSTNGCLELYGLPASRSFEIAVLGETLCAEDLTEAARFIRHRWPLVTILLVCAEPVLLEDALYDERLPAGLSQTKLTAELSRLGEGQQARRNRGERIWEC
ncbi:MAG TPA: hypothetical protein VGR96_10025 [Acidobacteriaceae bacterium]|nr:hypothetical protein [Acidobacteriaceae bacterium]